MSALCSPLMNSGDISFKLWYGLSFQNGLVFVGLAIIPDFDSLPHGPWHEWNLPPPPLKVVQLFIRIGLTRSGQPPGTLCSLWHPSGNAHLFISHNPPFIHTRSNDIRVKIVNYGGYCLLKSHQGSLHVTQ